MPLYYPSYQILLFLMLLRFFNALCDPSMIITTNRMKSSLRAREKKQAGQRRQLVQGVSRKIKRDLQDIIDSLDTDLRHKGESLKDQYKKICAQAEAVAQATNQCYNLWVNDCLPLTINNNRNPLILLKYCRLFLESLATLRTQQLKERQDRQRQNQTAVSSYNPNNVYELIAKKNIQFIEMQAQITALRAQKELNQKKAAVAEEMTEAVRSHSEDLLKAYRQNFSKIAELLKQAEQKETELLQSNRLLNERLQNLASEYDNYRMNFKLRPTSGQGQKRLRYRLQKQYEQRFKQTTRQLQLQLRNAYKAK